MSTNGTSSSSNAALLGLYNTHVVPADPADLKAVHDHALKKAAFYVSVILALYLAGLALVLVHYMNGAFGRWNWTLQDAWEEIKPEFGEREMQ